jgi:hypothetical protein
MIRVKDFRIKQVSGVRCQAERRSVRKSRAGHSARRIQDIAYYRIWSAQRPTLLILAVPDTRNLTPETYGYCSTTQS